jgi:acyl-homoserine-lactone acylase
MGYRHAEITAASPKPDQESTYITRALKRLPKTIKLRLTGNWKFLNAVIKNLQNRFGTWQVPWGDMNRYQRPADGITFDDKQPSIPVGLTGSGFGQLPSFQSRTVNTLKSAMDTRAIVLLRRLNLGQR